MENKKSILISTEIYSKIQNRSQVTGFNNVDEYIEYVLKQLIAKSQQKEVPNNNAEEKAIADELKKAGYLE